MAKEGLSPKTLGEKSNVSKSSIYNYIDGKYTPNRESCEKLAAFFGVSMMDLENKKLYPDDYGVEYRQTNENNFTEEPIQEYSRNTSKFQESTIEDLEKLEVLLKGENIKNKERIFFLVESLKVAFQKEALQVEFQANKIEHLLQENSRLQDKIEEESESGAEK